MAGHRFQASQNGVVAPSSVTPEFIGQVYRDVVGGKTYVADSLTPGDWEEIGSGGGNEDIDYVSLYAKSATYTVTGGADALKDSIALHGGGVDADHPVVYEIGDSLTYNPVGNLIGVNYIVVRGAVGHRPVIQTSNTNPNAFYVRNGTGTPGSSTQNITVGNLDINIAGDTADYQCAFLVSRITGATYTFSKLRVKDVKVSGAGYRRNGVVLKDEVGATDWWATDVIVEDCFFLNLYSGTDGGAIALFGVNGYIGNRNIFTWEAASYKTHYVISTSVGSEYNSVFNYSPSGSSDFRRTYAVIAQSYAYSCAGKDIEFLFRGCKFTGNIATTQGAIRLEHSMEGSSAIGEVVLNVDDCYFSGGLGAGVHVMGDSIDHGQLVTLNVTNCRFVNNAVGIRKGADFIAAFKALNIQKNDFWLNGANYSGFTANSDTKGDLPEPSLFRAGFFPPTLADASATNGSIFIGSDHTNKLCYKDGSGAVHELYT